MMTMVTLRRRKRYTRQFRISYQAGDPEFAKP
jgi:hypothetical protein